MINLVVLITLIMLIIYFILDESEIFSNRKNYVSSIDGREYKVVHGYSLNGGSPEDAADVLAFINGFLIKFMKNLKKKYANQDLYIEERNFTERLLKKYNPSVIVENKPNGIKNTSYVLNKGDLVAFCLREPHSGKDKLHRKNILKFVSLHELTHIGSKYYGHTIDFWKNFKFVLKEAEEFGLYDPIDYSLYPSDYCGMVVNYNPYFDERL